MLEESVKPDKMKCLKKISKNRFTVPASKQRGAAHENDCLADQVNLN